MNIQQLVSPTVVTPINARKVKPSKVTKSKVPSSLALEITALREELSTLTGAPCSPLMGVESLTKAIAKAKLPPEPEVEEVEVVVTEKTRTVPSKPVGITKYIVARLKEGVKAKDVLVGVYATFPTAQTSLACVYWCASKIKAGVM
jgi:hypothetical protein